MEGCVNLYLSSVDSTATFPSNTASDFTTLLPERLDLSPGRWWCILVDFQLDGLSPDNPLYLCCDTCDDAIIGQKKLPVLSRVSSETTRPTHVTHVKLKTSSVSTIRIYLTDREGRSISLNPGTSYCTLQFCDDETLRVNP